MREKSGLIAINNLLEKVNLLVKSNKQIQIDISVLDMQGDFFTTLAISEYNNTDQRIIKNSSSYFEGAISATELKVIFDFAFAISKQVTDATMRGKFINLSFGDLQMKFLANNEKMLKEYMHIFEAMVAGFNKKNLLVNMFDNADLDFKFEAYGLAETNIEDNNFWLDVLDKNPIRRSFKN